MNELGLMAEQIAARYLQANGLKLLSSNFNCRYGEIDLIMREGKSLVFVEVRLRSSNDFGGAVSSITSSKQHKLLRTAQHYMQLHGEAACRFDAVLMSGLDQAQIEWIKNAFQADI